MSEATTPPETSAEPLISSPYLAKKLMQSKMTASKYLFGITNSSKFVWHAALGTALATESSLVTFSKSMAAKSKAMAVKGSEIEAKAKADIAKKVFKVKESTASTKMKLTGLSKEKIEGIEKMINKGMNRSLHVVGVPTRGDLDKLALLMNEMSQSIEELAAIGESKIKRSSSSKSATV